MSVALACGRGDFPARHCRTRPGGGVVSQQETKAVMRAGGKRETAGRGQVCRIVGQFGDDACERAAFERLLHRQQRVGGASGAQHQKPSRRQPEQIESDAVGRAGLEPRHVGLDPKRLPAAAIAVFAGQRRKRQREAAGGTEMKGCRGRDFMQGAMSETSAEKSVHPPQPKRERCIITLITLDIFNLLTEARERVRGLHTGEEPLHGSIYVRVLFLLIPGTGAVCKDKIGPTIFLPIIH